MKKVIIMNFAENLQHYRKLKGLSRQEMAEKLNMQSSSYANYELNRAQPDATKLKIIAEMLEVSADELLDIHIQKNELRKAAAKWNEAGFVVFNAATENGDYVIIYSKKEMQNQQKDKKKLEDKAPLESYLIKVERFIEFTRELEDKSKELVKNQFADIAENFFFKLQPQSAKYQEIPITETGANE